MGNYAVIGASGGIGGELSKQLVNSGHSVWGSYHTNDIESAEVNTFQLDVRAENLDFSSLPDTLDGLAYCPGAITLKPFHRFSPDDFAKDYDLQVLGAIKCLQALHERLKKGHDPAVVLFSTVAVQSGFPFHSVVASSKGAVEGLTKALASEWAPNIRVNAIAPSLTDTPLAKQLLSSEDKRQANADRHPLKKLGEPQDIASMANFLLQEQASWVSGQIFHVDGGKSTLITS